MLTLSTVKDFLGVASSDYDNFLNTQITLVNRVINKFCERVLEKSDQTDYFCLDLPKKSFFLEQYPVNSIDTIEIDGQEYNYSRVSSAGEVFSDDYFPRGNAVVSYNSGYDENNIDPLLKDIFLTIIKVRYEKHISSDDFIGSDAVKRVSLTGVMSVEYRQGNDSFNDYLEGFQDALESFKSERTVLLC